MRSRVLHIERLSRPLEQIHRKRLCSAHGIDGCREDLVAEVVLRDAGSDRITWTVCERWLRTNPDAAAWTAEHSA